MSEDMRYGLARAIRDAYAVDVIPAETLTGPGWDGLVGTVHEWLPEADAALAYLAAHDATEIEALRAEVARLRRVVRTLSVETAYLNSDLIGAVAKIAAVEVLHQKDSHGPGRCDVQDCVTGCDECGQDWPCSTAAALTDEPRP